MSINVMHSDAGSSERFKNEQYLKYIIKIANKGTLKQV